MAQVGIVGAGHMGRSALNYILSARSDVSAIVVDRSTEALDAARAIAPDRVSTIAAEVSPALDFSSCDVVINLAGPFFTGSDDVARACLASGADYVDIADDVEATEAVLALDEDARREGISLVTGAGNSPGLSNWMACRLLDEDPSLDGIQVVWVVHEPDPGGLAPLRHMLHMAVAPCPLWQEGAATASRGFVPETGVVYDLPLPVGTREAFDTAHPEPLTLPRRYPNLRYVGCKGALTPEWANAAFSTLGRIGFGYHNERLAYGEVEIEPAEFLWRLMWQRYDRRPHEAADAVTMIHVIGMRGDEAVRALTIWDDKPMFRGTGIGAAAAGLVMLSGDRAPGAHGVEVLPWTRGLATAEALAGSDGGRPIGPQVTELSSASAGR